MNNLTWNPFTNNFDFTGSGSGGGSSPGGVSTWVAISTTTQAAMPDTGYVVGPSSTCTITLPSTIAFGHVIRIVGLTGGWIVQCNEGQQIISGNELSSVGGTIASSDIKDCVEILCINPNTFFQVISSVGNQSLS